MGGSDYIMDMSINKNKDEIIIAVMNDSNTEEWKWLSDCSELKLERTGYRVIKKGKDWQTVVKFKVAEVKVKKE